jgi:flagellar biosynthesis/type III secretory pathway M-ring protein FliF/YscJ
MSTYYDQMMQALGTNIVSTNPDFQAALKQESDALTAMVAAERQAEINSYLWHAGVLIATCLCAFFLWRIVQLKQKESANNRRASDERSTSLESPGREHADTKPTTAKPPLLDSQRHTLRPLPAEKAATDSPDFAAHPDSRFMPKS